MKQLDSKVRTTREVKVASDQAIEDFIAYQAMGSNLVHGGYDDQPAEWVDAIVCVQAAHNKARNELQEDIEKEEKKKAKRSK